METSHPSLILASASPRRKSLLEQIGLEFAIQTSTVEETVVPGMAPGALAEHLALLKARDVARHFDRGIVIGADTIVVCDDRILGKPNDPDDAVQTLRLLRGREHAVYTALALLDVATGREMAALQKTRVFMRAASDDEIGAYVATGEPLDKAGSYGIQGLGALLVERIDGDYFNVVGLPLVLLSELLGRFGVRVL